MTLNIFANQAASIPLSQLDANFAEVANSSGVTFLQAGTGAVARTVQGKERDIVSVKDFGAVGDGVTDDTAAIQAAIAAVTSGGSLYFPVGSYLVTGTFTIDKMMTIYGAGWGTIIKVGASVGASTDIFLLKPASASAVQGLRFQDIYIQPASGTPARYGFNIDGTNGAMSNIVFDHVRVDALGSYAIAVTNASVIVTGTPFTTTIRDGVFQGGIDLTYGGDNINLQNNVITGARDVKIGMTGAAGSDGGAHGFMLFNNNITCNGGLIITNAWQGTIAYNNFEQVAATTNANSALIDLQGNASANVQNIKIYGNYIGANSTYVTDSVRIDRITCAEFYGNYVVRGSGVAYRITANAVRTHIAYDRQALDEALTTVVADLGTATNIETFKQSSGIRTLTPSFQMSDNSGNTGVFLSSTQVRLCNNRVMGWVASTTDPVTSLVAGFSGDGTTGEVNLGNGTASDSSGHLIQTGGIDLGTAQAKRIRVNRGTALVAGDFALSAGWGTTASVGTVIGSDQAWTITVTSSGTGQGASPTITHTFKDGTFTNSPICISKMTGGTGTVTTTTETPTATTNVITFNGTPVAASTYVISNISFGR